MVFDGVGDLFGVVAGGEVDAGLGGVSGEVAGIVGVVVADELDEEDDEGGVGASDGSLQGRARGVLGQGHPLDLSQLESVEVGADGLGVSDAADEDEDLPAEPFAGLEHGGGPGFGCRRGFEEVLFALGLHRADEGREHGRVGVGLGPVREGFSRERVDEAAVGDGEAEVAEGGDRGGDFVPVGSRVLGRVLDDLPGMEADLIQGRLDGLGLVGSLVELGGEELDATNEIAALSGIGGVREHHVAFEADAPGGGLIAKPEVGLVLIEVGLGEPGAVERGTQGGARLGEELEGIVRDGEIVERELVNVLDEGDGVGVGEIGVGDEGEIAVGGLLAFLPEHPEEAVGRGLRGGEQLADALAYLDFLVGIGGNGSATNDDAARFFLEA